MTAAEDQDQAGIAARTAGYQRRADEWTLQANLAARELMQIGRQLIASLIAEQVAYHDYQTVKTQVQQAQDVSGLPADEVHQRGLLQLDAERISGLYYQYYRFACDTARKAEQTMKQELMRPNSMQPSSSSSTTGTAAIKDCFPARRCIWTSSGWRWPTTTTTSAKSS